MSNNALRRMYADIKQCQSANLESEGIFCSFNENDLFDVKAMIVGPKDTPYENGFYFFRLTFPHNYPFAPPKAVFETRYNTEHTKLRFNPNLYANGKVCVSILGTWSGPQWEPCQSLYSILLTLQTLLVTQPLTNEPGYNKQTPLLAPKHKRYTDMVTYENYRIAILRMLSHPPTGFDAFIPIMKQWTYQHAKSIGDRLSQAIKHMPIAKNETCFVYHKFATIIDYPRIYADFCNIRSTLELIYGNSEEKNSPSPTTKSSLKETIDAESLSNQNNQDVTSDSPKDSIQNQKMNNLMIKSKRKRPDKKACDQHYEIVKVTQSNGKSISYQSVPSEYYRSYSGAEPIKRTRWLWRLVDTNNMAMVAPSQSETSVLL